MINDSATLRNTPAQELFAEWQKQLEVTHDANISDEAAEAEDEALRRIEHALIATPSQSAADFAAKLLAYTHYGAFNLCDSVAPELWAEARTLTDTSAGGLQRESAGGVGITHDEIRAQRDELDKKLVDIRNLIDALQTVAWDMAQETFGEGSPQDRQRNAVIGLANAMEARAQTE